MLTNLTIKTFIYLKSLFIKIFIFQASILSLKPTPLKYNFIHKALFFFFSIFIELRDFLLKIFLFITLLKIF